MKRSRLAKKQIIRVLLEQEAGSATADVCRKLGTSPVAFYQRKAKFARLEVSEAQRFRTLEVKNVRLKNLLAEAMQDSAVLIDIAS